MTDEELSQQAQAGQESAVNQLLTKYKPLVNQIARSYFLTGGEMEDIVQEGMIGLFKAIMHYNGKSASFKTFASTCIKHQIQSAVRVASSEKNKILSSALPIIDLVNTEEEEDKSEIVFPSDLPSPDERLLEKERIMEIVENMVVLGRSARNLSNIKNRQPLAKLYFSMGGNVALDEKMYEIARDELNVKEFEVLTDSSKFINYKLKPQLKTLGPKYGSKLGLIRQYLDTCDANSVVKTIRESGQITVDLNGEQVVFTEQDLLISTESKEGFISASENGHTVVLDVNLTDELIAEGIVREVVSKVQTMRKEAGFNVTDRINLYFVTGSMVAVVIKNNQNHIAKVVLADSINEGKLNGYQKDWDINGEQVTLAVEKV